VPLLSGLDVLHSVVYYHGRLYLAEQGQISEVVSRFQVGMPCSDVFFCDFLSRLVPGCHVDVAIASR
jgi:hypothetical protein